MFFAVKIRVNSVKAWICSRMGQPCMWLSYIVPSITCEQRHLNTKTGKSREHGAACTDYDISNVISGDENSPRLCRGGVLWCPLFATCMFGDFHLHDNWERMGCLKHYVLPESSQTIKTRKRWRQDSTRPFSQTNEKDDTGKVSGVELNMNLTELIHQHLYFCFLF